MGTGRIEDRLKSGWRILAAGLVLAVLLFGPIALVATLANSPPRDISAADFTVTEGIAPIARTGPTNHDDVGNFAFGYVEFDVDPKRPGGVTGFDSWPPSSPRR